MKDIITSWQPSFESIRTRIRMCKYWYFPKPMRCSRIWSKTLIGSIFGFSSGERNLLTIEFQKLIGVAEVFDGSDREDLVSQ